MSDYRRTKTILFNKGLDKTSLPFGADPSRAIDELNYVYRDGMVQKRFGLTECAKIETFDYIPFGFDGSEGNASVRFDGGRFNGVWSFVDESGERCVVAHIGKLLFGMKTEDGVSAFHPIRKGSKELEGKELPLCYEFNDYKSSAVIGGNSLYFFGGNKFVRVNRAKNGDIASFDVFPVEDGEGTYVPTTTISITENGSAISGRQSLDEVNLMTELRKNELVGRTRLEGEGRFCDHEFLLDGKIVSKRDGEYREGLKSVSVSAKFVGNKSLNKTNASPLVADFAEMMFNVTEAEYATSELVIFNKEGKEVNIPLSISQGEPTRSETLLPEGYFAKVKIEMKKSVNSSYWDENDTTGISVRTLYTATIDLDQFISMSLISGARSWFASWESGASLSSYDKDYKRDRLILTWKQGKIAPTTIEKVAVVTINQPDVSIELESMPQRSERTITISDPYSDRGSTFYGAISLLMENKIEAVASNAEPFVEESTPIEMTLSSNGLYGSFISPFGEEKKVYGFIRDANETTDCASIVLFGDWDSVVVTFPCYVKGNAEKIDKCRIAKLFGNANAKNRLFVSGNPDFPNCDWHTSSTSAEIGGASSGDFTYFGDMSYCFYGQTDNAVMGYDNVATDKMVVIKSKSSVEPTNYFRSSATIQAVDGSGNAVYGVDGNALYQESFPLFTGNVGKGAMNMKSIANLNGDTLYLASDNTICGLDIAGQIGDTQRISSSRSRFIDPELGKMDLSDAVLWASNEDVYLFANEATYVSNFKTLSSENGQYEWFKIGVKGVRCAVEYNGLVHFGTENGKFFKLDPKSFFDCEKVYAEEGQIATSDERFIYGPGIGGKIDETADLSISLLNGTYYRKVASAKTSEEANADFVIDTANNSLRVSSIGEDGEKDFNRYSVLLEEMANPAPLYLDNVEGKLTLEGGSQEALPTAGVPYFFKPSSGTEDEYFVFDESGNKVSVALLQSATICSVLDGEYKIVDLDKGNQEFSVQYNGRQIDFHPYGSESSVISNIKAEISMKKPVKAYFISAPDVLGGISYRKTIWSWTMSAFNESNDLEVCQATNGEKFEDMREVFETGSVPIGLDFADFSFDMVDFDKGVVPRKYTYFRPLSVPFMSFGFKSDKPMNSMITSSSIVYTIPMLGRGDK